jgi:hypothetical protein
MTKRGRPPLPDSELKRPRRVKKKPELESVPDSELTRPKRKRKTKPELESIVSKLEEEFKKPKRKTKAETKPREMEGIRSVESLETKREAGAERARKNQKTVRNIGPIPEIGNIDRRLSCADSLLAFILTYAMQDKDPFSESHLKIINRIQLAIMHGGKYILAVWRGAGKTSITELSVLWGILYGHKYFIPIVTSAKQRSEEAINGIMSLLKIPEIMEDFPEVCFPLNALEGVNQRSKGQLYTNQAGELRHTNIKLSTTDIVLPSTDGSKDKAGNFYPNLACSAKITSCGITSTTIRGMRHFRNIDGVISTIRPDFCIIDDPQTEESSTSPLQINKRLDIINKAILKTAGHATSMSIVMPCTIISKGDMVDQMLDKKLYPSWQGEKMPFVKSWSNVHDTMWLQTYADIRNTYNSEDDNDFLRARKDANKYYEDNREEMDSGCEVAWSYCYNDQEISAIQHAYNSLIDDGEIVFQSEFQNDPIENKLYSQSGEQISLELLQTKFNNMPRLEIPTNVEKITGFIDIQGSVLFWMVCGWSMDFTGYVLDYGCWPDQRKQYFTLKDIDPTIFQKYPGTGQEAAWHRALTDLTKYIVERRYPRLDGTELSISRLLCDGNDGSALETVSNFCRTSIHKAVVMTARGRGVGASSKPFAEYTKARGDRVGLNWRIPAQKGVAANTRFILSDVNFWKSFVRSRLNVGIGDPGCLSICGQYKNSKMLVDHLTSEYSVRTAGLGREVDEWKIKVANSRNDYFDTLVGCAIAASEQGCEVQVVQGGITAVKRSMLANNAERVARLSRLGKVRV